MSKRKGPVSPGGQDILKPSPTVAGSDAFGSAASTDAMLTGNTGQPQSQADRRYVPEIIGTFGLRQFGGRVYEEFLTELVGPRWMRVVKEMSWNDPVVASMLFAIEMLCRRVTWKVEPYQGEGPEMQDASTGNQAQKDSDKQNAEFVESCLYDMSISWEDTLTEILTFLAYGYSYMETAFKLRGGPDQDDPTLRSRFSDRRVGWRKWIGLAQDTHWRWEFDEDGSTLGFWQIAPPKYIPTFVPIDKSLLFRTKATKGNPEGWSILRGAYEPWYFGKRLQRIEAIGAERDLAGMPVGYVPPEYLSPNATNDQKALVAQVKQMVTNIRRDEQEGIVWPLSYDEDGHLEFDLKLLSSGGARQFQTDPIIQRYDQRKAMTVLADFVLIGHEKVGSFALATSKTNIFGEAISAWLDGAANVINDHAIPRLMRINQLPIDRKPLLVHGEVQGADLAEVSKYLLELAQAGMVLFPDPDLTRHLLELAQLPAPNVQGAEWPAVEDARQIEAEIAAPGSPPSAVTSPAAAVQSITGGGAPPAAAGAAPSSPSSNGSGSPRAAS